MKSAEQIIEEMLEEDRLVEERGLETAFAALSQANHGLCDDDRVLARVRAALLERCGATVGAQAIRLIDTFLSWRELGRAQRRLLDGQNERLLAAARQRDASR